MSVNEDECLAAGLDVQEVKKLLRRLESVAKECDRLGLIIFGGAGSGSLRCRDQKSESGQAGLLIVADVNAGYWDGGDGGDGMDCGDGLRRGEH